METDAEAVDDGESEPKIVTSTFVVPALADAYAVHSFECVEELNRPYRANVRLIADEAFDGLELIGNEALFTLLRGGGRARRFHGLVDQVVVPDREDLTERRAVLDIIGYNDRPTSQGGHGGHVGIVIQDDAADGGSAAPMVINLPGPTYLRSAEASSYYRENGEHADGRPAGVRGDIVRERWPRSRIDDVPESRQFLIRLVCTLLHRGRRPNLRRDTARGPAR